MGTKKLKSPLEKIVTRQAQQLEKLREAVRRQTEALDAIALAAPSSAAASELLPSTLLAAHASLTANLDAVYALCGGRPPAVPSPAAPHREPAIDPFVGAKARQQGYELVPAAIAAATRAVVGQDAVTLVVSRGDQSLVDAAGPRGWHFPQNDDGVYAGYHPASSAQAIRHLEALRAKGAGFLLFPATAAWWLDYYGEFRRHLDARYRLAFAEPDQCAIYDLRQDLTTQRHHDDQRN